MPARKTERRIPDSLQAQDLGQTVTAGNCALVSYVTSPLVHNRNNHYVVFITDNGMATSANSYDWTITENSGAPINSTTQAGELDYRAVKLGRLVIAVSIKDGGNNELASLTLSQEVVDPSEELEDLIAESGDEPGPGMADPDALRELVNEYNLYYQSVTLQNAEPMGGFKRLVFNMVFDGVMKRSVEERKRHLDQLALSLNSATTDFATLSTQGAGVSSVRLLLLAMTLPNMIPWTLMPEDANERAIVLADLHQSLAQLDENKKIDLFNIVRFPKSNIKSCARILENLRNQYFNTTNFDDVLTGMSGARAQWIIAQYRQGPIIRN
jgi:hypothetical protein